MAVQDYIGDLIERCYPGASIEVEYTGEDGALICWLYNVPDGLENDSYNYPRCATLLEQLRELLQGEVYLVDADVEGLGTINTLYRMFAAENERAAVVVDGPDGALMEDERFEYLLHDLAAQGTDMIVLLH